MDQLQGVVDIVFIQYDDPLPDIATVAQLWRHRLEQNPESVFVRYGGTVHTTRQCDQRARRLQSGLRFAGIASGEFVGQLAAPGVDSVCEYLASSLAGSPIVPINTSFRGQLLAYVLNDCAPRLLYADASQLERIADVESAAPALELVVVHGTEDQIERERSRFRRIRLIAADEFADHEPDVVMPEIGRRDTNCVIYTSGTTGPSKGVLISNQLAVNKGLDFARLCQLGPADVMYSPLPLFHETGLFKALLGTMGAGGSILLRERFSGSQFWSDVRSAKVTVGVGFPTMQTWLLEAPATPDDKKHTLRRLLSLPNPEFARRFGVQPVASYGTTEITSAIHMRPHEELPMGSCGRASRDWEIRLVDDNGHDVPNGVIGELLLRPKAPGRIMSGYINQPEATQRALEDLWYHPGDLAARDENGFYFFKGRKKDVIRRRGENISAWELESILQRHPGVHTAAALARKRDDGDDDLWVILVAHDPDAPPDVADIEQYCRRELPDFMIPRYIEFRRDVPRTAATARVQKHALAAEGPGAGCVDLGERRPPRSPQPVASAVPAKENV